MSEWQSIETAPKDGTKIMLGWIPNWPTVDHYALAWWEPQRNGWSWGYINATHWKPAPPNDRAEPQSAPASTASHP